MKLFLRRTLVHLELHLAICSQALEISNNCTLESWLPMDENYYTAQVCDATEAQCMFICLANKNFLLSN